MSKQWKTAKLKKLMEIILLLKDEKDLINFFRDLCTLEELDEMSTRWQVVNLLSLGAPYRLIAKKTGVSTSTVTRIAHWLENGEGGYKTALKKMSE